MNPQSIFPLGFRLPLLVALAGLLTSPCRADEGMDLAFTALDGREVDLSKLRGKVVLVDFWATWCGPCVEGLPTLAELYRKFHGQGLEIIGISLDEDKAALERMIQAREIPWPQYYDGKGWDNAVSAKHGIDAIPAVWLIDKEGRIHSKNARNNLTERVESLLAAEPGAADKDDPVWGNTPFTGDDLAKMLELNASKETITFPTPRFVTLRIGSQDFVVGNGDTPTSSVTLMLFYPPERPYSQVQFWFTDNDSGASLHSSFNADLSKCLVTNTGVVNGTFTIVAAETEDMKDPLYRIEILASETKP